MRRICAFCASSRRVARHYLDAAAQVGADIAARGATLVYGGGRTGLMGAAADAALARGGSVIGVLPRFMDEVEWGHRNLTELRLVESMEARLGAMLAESDAFIVLPGGTGTLEELFFILSRKKLGLHGGPIVMLNLRGYFDPCLAMLRRCFEEHFIDARFDGMWSVVDHAEEVVPAVFATPPWVADHRRLAVP